jgi:secreted PhoX family phosphatase
MGRFKHEAAAADPVRHVIYLTEDEPDGKFYRFIPTTWGDLSSGTLQVLKAGTATSGS